MTAVILKLPFSKNKKKPKKKPPPPKQQQQQQNENKTKHKGKKKKWIKCNHIYSFNNFRMVIFSPFLKLCISLGLMFLYWSWEQIMNN